ncbi:hypothetical protein ACTXT7_003131 [Hymenolepis weldensis]
MEGAWDKELGLPIKSDATRSMLILVHSMLVFLDLDLMSALHNQHRIYNNLTIPIVLPVSEEDRNRLSTDFKHITLTYHQNVIAVLQNIEFYPHRKEERCSRIFGICDRGHPTIDQIMSAGDWLVGGDLKVFEKIVWNDGLDQFRLSPLQLREKYKELGIESMRFRNWED